MHVAGVDFDLNRRAGDLKLGNTGIAANYLTAKQTDLDEFSRSKTER